MSNTRTKDRLSECIQSKIWGDLISIKVLDDFKELHRIKWFLLNHSRISSKTMGF